MKLLFLAILFFSSFSLAQTPNYGKKLDLAQGQDGRPVISFLYDSSARSFFLIQIRFLTSEIVKFKKDIYPVYMSFVNFETGEALIPWTEIPHQKGEIADAETSLQLMSLESEKTTDVVQSFNKVLIVLSFKKTGLEASADFHINLREICDSHPELFQNLDGQTLCQ